MKHIAGENRNLCDVYIENFLTNHPMKEFLKISLHMQKKTWYLKIYVFYWATLYISSCICSVH